VLHPKEDEELPSKKGWKNAVFDTIVVDVYLTDMNSEPNTALVYLLT
jgi:hypothetical protein